MQMWSYKLADVDPFVIKWPKQWTSDPEIGPVIHYLNRFLHDLWVRTGAGDDVIESAAAASVLGPLLANLHDIQTQIGSGDFLTVDTTGFTVDTTLIFADEVEA